MASRTDHRDSLTLAAATSDISIDYIDGVPGDKVLDKVLPPDSSREKLGNGNIGSWRAHMDAIHAVVAGNYSSALIVEDDIDWDIRIKDQLRAFAAGARALNQPLTGTDRTYADPTFLTHDPTDNPIVLDSAAAPSTVPPTMSPYGDNWDVLWLGHCGARFPEPSDPKKAKGRYVIHNDDTVPLSKHRHALNEPDATLYPEHTRVIHHGIGPICTFAYAVSLRGARKIMHQIGMKSFGAAYDNILADFCNDNDCITTQPELFHHWRKAGNTAGDSDITDWSAGDASGATFRAKGHSNHMRWSVRMNLERIVKGLEVQDQFPDDAAPDS